MTNIKTVKKCGMMHIEDCRSRANIAGLAPAEAVIAESIYESFAQYRVAAKVLAAGGIYRRSTPQFGNDFYGARGTTSAYIWDARRESLDTICEETTYHRAKVAIRAYSDYLSGKIAPEIWNNYITNGYHTRRGLYARYTDNATNTIQTIARSHADYLGQETGNSAYDHNARVAMRA